MKRVVNHSKAMRIVLIVAAAALAGCMATTTTQAPPPMAKKPGVALTAAMLPIKTSNEPETADHVTSYLSKCLQDRNAFVFISKDKVDQAIAAGGYDMTQIFGLSEAEYKALGEALGVDYVLHGIVAVRKSLKFTGWRKDVDAYIKLYEGKSGKSVDSWRSVTDFAFTDANTETDSQKMAESAANHVCAKIIQSGY